jgi:hypothetical protein
MKKPAEAAMDEVVRDFIASYSRNPMSEAEMAERIGFAGMNAIYGRGEIALKPNTFSQGPDVIGTWGRMPFAGEIKLGRSGSDNPARLLSPTQRGLQGSTDYLRAFVQRHGCALTSPPYFGRPPLGEDAWTSYLRTFLEFAKAMLGEKARIVLTHSVVCVVDLQNGVVEFGRLNTTATKIWGKMKAFRLDIVSVAQLRRLLHTDGKMREHTAAVRGVRSQSPARMRLQPHEAIVSRRR